MKKIFLFIALILGTSLSSFANEALGINQGGQTITMVENELNVPVNNSNVKTSDNSKIDASIQDSLKKKKKKKMKTWHYIAGGAFLLLVIVIYVITGGEGYSSR